MKNETDNHIHFDAYTYNDKHEKEYLSQVSMNTDYFNQKRVSVLSKALEIFIKEIINNAKIKVEKITIKIK